MKTALFTVAKDEDHYIDEWLDYHVKLGFDDIFVCQNNWRANLQTDFNGKIHLSEANYEAPQAAEFNKFVKTRWRDYDFAAFFDVDEFLLLKNHANVKDFLANYLEYPAIGVNWRIFGDNGRTCIENGDYSVTERFLRSDDKLDRLIKLILNFKLGKDRFEFFNPHIVNCHAVDPNLTKTTVNGNFINNTENEIAELAHYRNKTREERFARKFNTDDVYFGYIKNQNYVSERTDIDTFNKEFAEFNKNTIQNTSVLDFYRKLRSLNNQT